MNIIRKHLPGYLMTLLGVFTFVYIVYHTFEGRYSFVNKVKMESEVIKGKNILASLKLKRLGLEQKISTIDEVIDLSQLEFEVRKNGLVAPNEIIVPMKH